ncbi:MAG: zinc metallopeptidase [Bacilli bacterium]|nr:zinc metallopeptidase [Bacilli bacterium]
MYFGYENMASTLLLIIGFLIASGAQLFVTSSYNKYKKVGNKKGLTGFEVARKILDKNGLDKVHIVETRGLLSDHYDPRRKVVRLSTEIFHGDSIASASVAAHEVGHAIQDKEGYLYMKIRSFLVPFVNIGTSLGYIAILIGFITNALNMIDLGIILLSSMILFQIVTLPVEFNASKRAGIELKNEKLLESNELDKSSNMLTAAAFTYVASVLTTMLQLLRLIVLSRDDRR